MTEQTLDTTAEVTNAGGSPAPEATGGSSQPEASSQQQTTETTTTEKAEAPETADEVTLDPDAAEQTEPDAETKGEAEKKDEAEQPKSWDGFELTAPEGQSPLSPEQVKEDLAVVGQACRDAGIEPKSAQTMIDTVLPLLRAKTMERIAAEQQKRHEAMRSDDVLRGGPGFDENLGIIKNAMATFGGPELGELLSDADFDFRPIEEMRAWLKVGKAIRRDTKVVKGEDAGSKPEGPMARLEQSYKQREAAAMRGE